MVLQRVNWDMQVLGAGERKDSLINVINWGKGIVKKYKSQLEFQLDCGEGCDKEEFEKVV